MNFLLSETQEIFRSSLRRFLTEHPDAPFAKLAELGVCVAMLPESAGGLGGDSLDAMVIAEEFGRAVAPSDFIDTCIIAAGLIDRLGSSAQKQALLPLIAAGSLTVALAVADVGTTFFDEQNRLHGFKRIVTGAPAAQLLIVSANHPRGMSLFCFGPEVAGVTMQAWSTIDRLPAASISFDGVDVSAAQLGMTADSGAALDDLMEVGLSAQCSEAVGIMATLINATVEHLKTRRQFGVALADFQALQHRLADMYLAYELARSMSMKASILCSGQQSLDRSRAVAAAKVAVSRAGLAVGHGAIQLHGAMGMSNEFVVGRAVKRLRGLEPRLGSGKAMLEKYYSLGQTGSST